MTDRYNELRTIRGERWVSNVIRGKFPLRAILSTAYREQIEKKVIDAYVDKTLPKAGLIALIEHQMIMMKIRGKSIDMMPEEIRPLMQKMIDANVQVDENEGLVDFDETLLDGEVI